MSQRHARTTKSLRSLRKGRALTLACACVSIFTFPPAAAIAAEGIHLDLEVGTELPVMLGAGAIATWPNGLRVSTGLGYLPRGYVSLINEVVESLPNTYDASTGDLIEETLQHSLIWRTHVGWQFSNGLFVEGGYRLAALGGGTSTEALLAGITGWDNPSNVDASASYSVGSVIHLLDAEVGWTKVFDDRWMVRGSLGIAATVGASSSVDAADEPDGAGRQRAVEEFERFTEAYLVDTYTTYVFTPVITVMVGYRLF